MGKWENEYGQFGIGTYGIDEYYEEPIRIAEKVVSVDASWNDYFCIYLTEDGKLFGIGLNYGGILLGKGSENTVLYSHEDYQKVTTPVLLMDHVIYAKAGRECIVALKEDGSAYWWGQYAPTTHSREIDVYDYWRVEEDPQNPAKMFTSEPMKIMDHCKYITTGTYTGAAINTNDELYTWGFNVWGQCGTAVRGDDFIRTPVKVMDDVKMVWVDCIKCNDEATKPSDINRMDCDYPFNSFVLTENNELQAVGLNLGNQEKVTAMNGDLYSTEIHLYSDTYVPIQVVEYSEESKRKNLNKLTYGMTMEEIEKILGQSGMNSFRTEVDGDTYLCIEDSRYYCYFDKSGRFNSLYIQEGGSRDNTFKIGMSLEELSVIVESAGQTLVKETEYIYSFTDLKKSIQYKFYVYEGEISSLWENESLE